MRVMPRGVRVDKRHTPASRCWLKLSTKKEKPLLSLFGKRPCWSFILQMLAQFLKGGRVVRVNTLPQPVKRYGGIEDHLSVNGAALLFLLPPHS